MITTLNQSKKILKKPRIFVEALYNNEIDSESSFVNSDVTNAVFRYVSEFKPLYKQETSFNEWSTQIDYKDSFKDFLLDLARLKINLFYSDDQAKTIIQIHNLKKHWIRPLNAWKRKSYNDIKQLTSLVRYLFCKYPDVPIFMDKIWFENNGLYIDWFIFLGQGGNIRKAEAFPIDYTKKMAFNFLNAPDDYTVTEAIYWGYIHGIGGNERLVRSICGTFIGESFKNFDFWGTVIQWFINNPMLDHMKVQPICDYLRHMKFEQQRLGIQEPLMPNLTMKGRTVEAILRDMERWHNQTQGRRGKVITKWQPLSIKDFIYTEGKDEHRRTWQINQLLDSKELATEGKTLKHCVGSYAGSCAAGRSAIFSLNLSNSFNDNQKQLTIEVSNLKRIGQIQGKTNNRMPTPKQKAIIKRWSEKEGLTISRWV